MNDKKEADNKSQFNQIGYWLAIGTGVGTALGAALGNIGVGVALGAGLGMAIGVIFSQRR
ncbi:MAG: hypothetical protein ACE5HS_11675 [bacterium]